MALFDSFLRTLQSGEEPGYRPSNPAPEHFNSKKGPEQSGKQKLEEHASGPKIDVGVSLLGRRRQNESSYQECG